ncbi:MAG: VWA domain-containing protein [Arachidicoccus sp.]|nr:VWA domain-containing protein [Arachidicoccus sp.]
MHISFEHIGYLSTIAALAFLVFLFIRLLRLKSKIRQSLGDEVLVKKLTSSYSSKLFNLKFYLILIALFFGIIAAANLRRNDSKKEENSAGIDVIIALDVSKSMLSQDIKPTRLDRAKQLISKLTDQLYNNRVGFVVFAGQAILQMPLTDDAGAVKMYLSNINTDAVPIQGTAIGDALLTANNALDEHDKKHKAVILITDGEDHDKSTDNAVKTLTDAGVTVFTIGVGTANGSPILDPATNEYKKDENGNTVISKLNDAELKMIAKNTGGEFALLDNNLSVTNDIIKKINSMEKKLIVSGKMGRINYFYFFPYLIAIMLLLLIIELFIPERKKNLV